MSYQVRNDKLEELLREQAQVLKTKMPAGYGFTLLLFGYDSPELFYISSAEREGMIETMKEFISKAEIKRTEGNERTRR